MSPRVSVGQAGGGRRRARTGPRIAAVQHEAATGLGVFGDLIREFGVAPEVVRVAEDPEALDGVIVLGGSAQATDHAAVPTQPSTSTIGGMAAEFAVDVAYAIVTAQHRHARTQHAAAIFARWGSDPMAR